MTQSPMRHLKNPELFVDLAGVPDRTAEAATKRFSVFNPSTGDLLAELPDMGVRHVSRAIDKAQAAQEHWAALTARERSDRLWEWHQLILNHGEDLAAIFTAEMCMCLGME
ncbi:aldehyde dehydrogenase family protein [Mesorhizobium sp. M0118]|uniref:aldehyde dehydrogenase family protein n=1 Tax=Mesorhizobium sp. M0118 TaxID=2956884 RepID=UPI00333AC85B